MTDTLTSVGDQKYIRPQTEKKTSSCVEIVLSSVIRTIRMYLQSSSCLFLLLIAVIVVTLRLSSIRMMESLATAQISRNR